VYGSFFTDKADRQYVSRGGSLFDRGTIYFTDKTSNLVSAATLKSGFTLALNTKLLTDATSTYEKINKLYPLPADIYFAKALKPNDPYEELVNKIPEESGNAIAVLKLPGVIVEKERWRYYPGNTLSAQTLGFVGFKNDVLTGQYGVERYYNDILSRDSSGAYANFFAQIFSNLKNTVAERDYHGEGDLVLTIEPSVQQFLEEQLAEVKKQYSADAAGGIIMNPQNGEIYAIGANPNFNPNTYNEEKNPAVFGNPLVENVYEMGSIIKPLTMAAGLDAGVVTPETTYDDKGTIELNGKKISNYDGKARGVVPMQEVLSQSLNVGVSFVEQKLGNEKFTEYFKNYGLGEETGIDLPGEVAGLIKNLDSPRDVEHATAAFGQGIALTPIETVRALASLGNGGRLVTPHVVKQVRYKVGVTKDISYDDGDQVISKETSDTITRMLVTVVDKALQHGKIKLDHYSVAAKTGTAQIANPATGKYYEDRYLHSFFGYFPAYNPQFIVFFYLYYPKNVAYASETLTLPFANTSKFLLNYYNVAPDR
jgi:cell division protein FtsI/penicillin-binding protein 2